MDSFYFNWRGKITIIPNRLDKIFCCMANMLQFWHNSNGIEVRSLLIDIYADPRCSTPWRGSCSRLAQGWFTPIRDQWFALQATPTRNELYAKKGKYRKLNQWPYLDATSFRLTWATTGVTSGRAALEVASGWRRSTRGPKSGCLRPSRRTWPNKRPAGEGHLPLKNKCQV